MPAFRYPVWPGVTSHYAITRGDSHHCHMRCDCPPEELRPAFEGRSRPVPGRYVCMICGSTVYGRLVYLPRTRRP